ncbi:MAG: hypothetical protein IKY51_01575 [Alistipes sp.]|nr:hypothetical protein [Alistipes sp.]
MKKLLLALAVVGATLFTACNNDQDCGHEFIEYDNTKNLVGTWTYLEEGQAEAMVIKEDGSFTITGVMNGGVGALYEEKGTIKVVNNKVTLAYNSGDVFEGRLELVAGKSLSIVINEEYDIHLTYDYCENDLSDEIVGMWICTDAPTTSGESMIVHTFMDNGKAIYTGFGTYSNEYIVNKETTYEVVGDLLFYALPQDNLIEGAPTYITKKLTYKPNGVAYGDIMEEKVIMSEVEMTSTMLRIKQSLNLTNRAYDYITAYVTNAKGKDEDFSIVGNTFNISKIKSNDLDAMFRSILSCIEINADSFKYKLCLDGREIELNDPITVDGNKVTLDMSATNSACRKVDMYMFQDASDSQLQIYMPTASFINYFANLQIPTLVSEGKLDTTDAAAVEKVFTDMGARIESINVSLVYKARK